MRTVAFGYSNRCNIKCEHCVAKGDETKTQKMDFEVASNTIRDLAKAKVQGISFTAGEPFIYLEDLQKLISVCSGYGIYTRVVTNSSWATSKQKADETVSFLKKAGLCQLRLSLSRWHEVGVPRENILNAVAGCKEAGVDYFISFVTDFSPEDDDCELFLRENNLKFFPEPVIFSGRAKDFKREPLRTDFQSNCCPMNPYIAPSGNMFACCDAGSHFTKTNFFHLGNVNETDVSDLFLKTETNSLYNHIRNLGISTLASIAGFSSRDIITYRKCELCEKLFNSESTLEFLQERADSELNRWYR